MSVVLKLIFEIGGLNQLAQLYKTMHTRKHSIEKIIGDNIISGLAYLHGNGHGRVGVLRNHGDGGRSSKYCLISIEELNGNRFA